MLRDWGRKITRQRLLVLGLATLFAWSGSAAITLRAMQGANPNPNTFEEEHRTKDFETKHTSVVRRSGVRAALVHAGERHATTVLPACGQSRRPCPSFHAFDVDFRNGIGCPLRC